VAGNLFLEAARREPPAADPTAGRRCTALERASVSQPIAQPWAFMKRLRKVSWQKERSGERGSEIQSDQTPGALSHRMDIASVRAFGVPRRYVETT
jgi:hypothetical protein